MPLKFKDWDKHYEKAHSRKVIDARWVAMPIRHDGKSFRRIARMKNCAEVWSGFTLLVEIAAKMPVRGVLHDDGRDITVEDMELITGFPACIFQAAIPVLKSPEIDWMDGEIEGDSITVKSHSTPVESDSNACPPQTDNTDKTNNISQIRKNQFDEARKLYPGTKRGLDTEYSNFQKKHKDWTDIVQNLRLAVQCEINRKAELKRRGEFCPEWKNFKTWINQRCWEESAEPVQNSSSPAPGESDSEKAIRKTKQQQAELEKSIEGEEPASAEDYQQLTNAINQMAGGFAFPDAEK